jgi:hypothetical protein
MTDPRLSQARRILGERGFTALPAVAGLADDVLALRAPIEDLEPLRELVPELKALGFKYVTLELDSEEQRDS